jgi:hypothetical protein
MPRLAALAKGAIANDSPAAWVGEGIQRLEVTDSQSKCRGLRCRCGAVNADDLAEGIKSKTTGAIYQNPYLAVANRAMTQMRDFLTEFGMTPSSQSRISSGLPPVRDEKFQKLFWVV